MAKTKELKKRSWGMKKAKNHHLSFGKSPVSRAALPFSDRYSLWVRTDFKELNTT